MNEDVLKKDNEDKEHTEQAKNPYSFEFGEYEVNVKFSETGKTLEDCLLNCMKSI